MANKPVNQEKQENNKVIENTVNEEAVSTENLERSLEREFKKEEQSVKQILDSEEKVRILIPEDPLNPGDVVPVGVNGVIYAIPRGKEFLVPKSIYDTWSYSYQKTLIANSKIKVAALEEKEIEILS